MPCCGARGAMRISTSCTPGACVDGNGRARLPISSRYRCWIRDGVLSMAVAPSDGGDGMTGAVRRSGAHPGRPGGSAAGRRALRDVRGADRRRASACGECRRPPADVRLPRLLPAVHRHPRHAALSRGARSLPGLPGVRAGPPANGRPCRFRSGWRSSSATRRWTGRSRSIPGPAGATESELDLAAWNDIRAADPRVDMLADDTEALLVRVPDDDETATARVLSGAHRRLLRVRRPAANAVARLRRRPAGARVRRRVLRASSTARSKVVSP